MARADVANLTASERVTMETFGREWDEDHAEVGSRIEWIVFRLEQQVEQAAPHERAAAKRILRKLGMR